MDARALADLVPLCHSGLCERLAARPRRMIWGRGSTMPAGSPGCASPNRLADAIFHPMKPRARDDWLRSTGPELRSGTEAGRTVCIPTPVIAFRKPVTNPTRTTQNDWYGFGSGPACRRVGIVSFAGRVLSDFSMCGDCDLPIAGILSNLINYVSGAAGPLAVT